MKKLFILGSQRSGTSILSSVLGELSECRHFPETNALINSNDKMESGQSIRLKDFDEVSMIFDSTDINKKLIVAKPLVESQNALKMLNYFDDLSILWVYRNYLDVVASNIKKWERPKAEEYFRPILNKSQGNWRSENLTNNCYKTFYDFYDPEMTSADATALFWLIRNLLFFEQNLESNSNVELVNYEKLVSENGYLQNKLNKLEIDLLIKEEKHKFNQKSIEKGSGIILNKELATACEDIYVKLRNMESKSV